MIVLSTLVYVAQAHTKQQDVTMIFGNISCPTFQDVYPVHDTTTATYIMIALFVLAVVLVLADAGLHFWKRIKSKNSQDHDFEVGVRSDPVVSVLRSEKKSRGRRRSEIRIDTLALPCRSNAEEVSPNVLSPPRYTDRFSGSIASLLP